MSGSDDSLDDVYICYDGQLAERAVEVLEDAGVPCMLRDRTSSAFPVHVGLADQRVLAVATHLAVQARSCLRAALEDGVLNGDGTLLE